MKRTITENEIKQEFDLEELLGYSPSPKQKELFYDLAVNEMVERTINGVDYTGNKSFPIYTEEYAKRKGVTRSSVDLVLEGEMLDSFSKTMPGDRVIIEVKSSQTGKAHGNITGSYGRPNPVRSKARDFFGFKSKEQLRDIISQVDSAKETDAEFFRSNTNLAELRKALSQITIQFQGTNGES